MSKLGICVEVLFLMESSKILITRYNTGLRRGGGAGGPVCRDDIGGTTVSKSIDFFPFHST